MSILPVLPIHPLHFYIEFAFRITRWMQPIYHGCSLARCARILTRRDFLPVHSPYVCRIFDPWHAYTSILLSIHPSLSLCLQIARSLYMDEIGGIIEEPKSVMISMTAFRCKPQAWRVGERKDLWSLVFLAFDEWLGVSDAGVLYPVFFAYTLTISEVGM